MVLHHATDEEDGGVIEPLLTRASSSTNATITQQPQGVTEGYYTIPPPDQKYFHFDGEPQHLMNPSRRHSIAGYQHHPRSHHHHDLVVAPLRPLLLPPSERRRAPQPPVVVDEDAVIRKIDWRLMPLLFVTQVLASADAAALAGAVFLGGLPEDAHLRPGASDYRALSAWLWLGYLLWVYPTCFFLSTLNTGGPPTAPGKRGRSASNSSSFYTSMYSANSSESLSLFFLSSAESDSSSIISTSSDSSSFVSVYSWDSDSPKNKKGGSGRGVGGNAGGGDDEDDEELEGIRFGVARYLGLNTLAWGAAVAATALTTSYAGLAAARFLLGAAEATVIPALMLVTTTWYARNEVPLRTGIWFAGSAAGPVVSTALGHFLVFLQSLGGGDVDSGTSINTFSNDNNASGGDFGFGFFVGILPSWSPWRWTFLLLGAATFVWGFVILYRLLDPISPSSSSDTSSSSSKMYSTAPSASNFPGTAAERQWDLDRVAAAETPNRQLWARSSHARPQPVPDWKWRQARDCVRDPQTWLVVAMSLLSQIPLASMRGLADLVILGSGSGSDPSGDGSAAAPAPSTMPMSLEITYMLLTMASMIGSGWLAGRFSSLTCTLIALAVLPPAIGSICVAKQLHYPSNSSNDGSGSHLLDDDTWPPSPTHQILAAMLLCTAPAVLPLLLSLVQANVRGLTKKTTTQALALIAYCLGNLLSPRVYNDEDALLDSGDGRDSASRRAEKEASYHTAVHAIILCHLSIAALAFGLRTYLRRRNRTKQDNEMSEVIDAIETRGGVTEYSLYRGAVDEEAYYRDNGETAISGGNDHLLPDDFDDMTDWKIPGFQYRC